MNFLTSDDVIIACSTNNTSNSAIAIIRISGFNDLSFLEDCLSISFEKIKSRYAHFCSLLDNGKKIDDIVMTFFKAPNTYNGENILELSVHGNVLNIENIISFFVNTKGFRRAYPGEFSYRALRNKKLNLSQVEGLDLLLNASSNMALNQGNSLLSGELKESFSSLYKSFMTHKSSVELSIDFLDDVGEDESDKQLKNSFSELKKCVNQLSKNVSNNKYNLTKPDICLFGKPNAGKSSLFNQLLNNDRSIVSSIAGTTRDYIKENMIIENTIFSLIDTAGFRKTADEIEEIGIDKAFKVFNHSFYKILLVNPFNFSKEDTLPNDVDLILLTHNDQEGFQEAVLRFLNIFFGPIGAEKSFGPIEPDKVYGPIGAGKNFGPIEPDKIYGPIGADSNSGPIEPLILASIDSTNLNDAQSISIQRIILGKFSQVSADNPILLDRHIDSIKKLKSLIDSYELTLMNSDDISIISSELNIVGHCISELIGIVSPEDVLQNIFNNFCIGK